LVKKYLINTNIFSLRIKANSIENNIDGMDLVVSRQNWFFFSSRARRRVLFFVFDVMAAAALLCCKINFFQTEDDQLKNNKIV